MYNIDDNIFFDEFAFTSQGEFMDNLTDDFKLGSAELISSHRQRVADVTPHSDEVDKKTP